MPSKTSTTVTLAAALSAAAFCSVAVAQSPSPLGPGLEREVAELVVDGEDRAPLPLDFGVTGGALGSDRITLTLAGPAGEFEVVLAHPEAELRRVIGRTASFVVALAQPPALDGAPELDVGRALVARLADRDDGSFWAVAAARAPRVRDGRAPPSSSLVDRTRRAVSWAGLAAVLLFFAAAGLRRCKVAGVPWRRAVSLAALFALAITVRLAVPPWAPVHSNGHGVAELRGLSGAVTGLGHEAHRYGGAYLEVVRGVAPALGDDAHLALALGAVFGALTVLGLYLLAERLFVGHRAAAAVAAVAAVGLALDPAHVRLSLSESSRTLAMLLFVVGLVFAAAAVGDAPRRRRFIAAWGAGFAFALAAELRVVTLFLPIAGAIFVALGVPRAPRGAQALAVFVGPGLWAAFSMVGHGAELSALLAGAPATTRLPPLAVLGELGTRANILFDFSYTPVVALAGAALGVVALVREGRWRLLAAMALAWLPLYGPALWVRVCRTDTLRYQTDLHLPLFVLVGAALVLLPKEHPRARLLALLALAAVAFGAGPGLVEAAAGDIQSASYRRAIEGAPEPATVISLAPETMAAARVRVEFPDYRVADPARIHRGASGPDCEVYVGVTCWSFSREEDLADAPRISGEPFRAECIALLGGPRAAEAAVAALPVAAVPHRAGEFHVIPAQHPRLGYAPCAVVGDPN